MSYGLLQRRLHSQLVPSPRTALEFALPADHQLQLYRPLRYTRPTTTRRSYTFFEFEYDIENVEWLLSALSCQGFYWRVYRGTRYVHKDSDDPSVSRSNPCIVIDAIFSFGGYCVQGTLRLVSVVEKAHAFVRASDYEMIGVRVLEYTLVDPDTMTNMHLEDRRVSVHVVRPDIEEDEDEEDDVVSDSDDELDLQVLVEVRDLL